MHILYFNIHGCVYNNLPILQFYAIKGMVKHLKLNYGDS